MPVAYGIFSGGLDSMLAALTLEKQGVDVRLLNFVTPFFDPERALASGRVIGMEVRLVDVTGPHLAMLQKPKHGYGRFMNPCIDCHALMYNQAGRIMKEEGGGFLFSGEVLGQRPKSQTRRALEIVARESGYAEVIVRPLSARVLPPTRVEEEGLVDRERLLGFSGRTRKPQMELAARYGLTDYPAPAGGCLLTDPIFSKRLKEVMAHESTLEIRSVELLKWGRHFRLPGGAKLFVGRNHKENEALEGLVRPGDLVFKVEGIPGPLTLMAGGALYGDRDLAASITVSYSDAPDLEPFTVSMAHGEEVEYLEAAGQPKKVWARYMIQ